MYSISKGLQPYRSSSKALLPSGRYELFSGQVISVKSEAVDSGQGWLLAAARAVGLWRKLPTAALHELVVQSPDGRSRTFRCGTSRRLQSPKPS